MTKVSPNNTATALPAESVTINIPVPADIENALYDLDGIGALLLDVAASIDVGSVPSARSMYFLGTTISDRAHTLADDLGMKVFRQDGEG